MKKISFLFGFIFFFLAQYLQELIMHEYELPGWFFIEKYLQSNTIQLIAYFIIYNIIGVVFILIYKKIFHREQLVNGKFLVINLLLFNAGICANVLILLVRLNNAQWIL